MKKRSRTSSGPTLKELVRSLKSFSKKKPKNASISRRLSKEYDITDAFTFIFNDKNGISESLFNHCYNPPIIRNLDMPFKSPSSENVYSEYFRKGLKGEKVNITTKKETELTWFAGIYYPNTFHFQVSITTPEKRTTFSKRNSWTIFCRYASFQEILDALEPMTTLKTYSVITKALEQNDDKALLNLIRDFPQWILHNEIRFRFIKILETARWSSNKKIRSNALHLLKSQLLPKHPRGKIPIPPGYNYGLMFLNELAEYLSRKYKLAYEDYFMFDAMDEPPYPALKNIAKEHKDYRISTLTDSDLERLIFKPELFVQDIIASHFKASFKTMKRRADN